MCSMDVLCFGEPLVGFYPPIGTSLAEEVPVMKTWGGDTSNVALGVAKLGKHAGYLSRVGSDPFGDGFLNLWNTNGVDTSLVTVDSTRNTGLYFVSFEGRHHKLTYYRKDSAASALGPEYITDEMIEQTSIIHLSGISIGMSPMAEQAGLELVKKARRLGKTVSFDVNYRAAQWSTVESAALSIETLINVGVKILEITDDEMVALGWHFSYEELLKKFPNVETIVLKQGDRGATIITSHEIFSVPACHVSVKDTVGAGDSFDAGFLVALLDDYDLYKAARFATVVAAHTCTGSGPLEKMPTKKDVDNLVCKSGYEI